MFYEPASELEPAAKARDLVTIEPYLQQIHGLAKRIANQDQLTTVDNASSSL